MRLPVRRVFKLGAALVLLAAVAWWVDPQPLGQTLARADASWVLIGLLTSTAANAASAWRWRALVDWMGWRMPLAWALPVYFRGVAANAWLPGAVVGGDVLRAWALHQRGVPVAQASASVLLDRLSGLWVLGVLGVAGLALGHGLDRAWALLGGAALDESQILALRGVLWTVALLLLVLPYAVLRLPATAWGARLPHWGWWHRLAHHAPGPQVLRQLLGSLVVQGLSIATLGACLHAVGAPLPWTVVAAAAVPIFVFATLPISFGGWGTREAAAVAVLLPLGVSGAQAMAASVLYGLFPVVQSALALWPLPAANATRPPQR
ncbi:lysylphosphatidylglycerol synthase transmembrane domain-containing protein [Tepidimonas charontis]|uniref:Lysylphosphatidylglycerol synthase TM region n=1 Tax=Tepidimonas charontis TaxID=2267262 RepID=A0A554XEH3_9BURK|nr:lysylphosphatidylglycerol synthase transmembrane domain-containing protein [Tepidimonas charontis]TSE34230.1 hypothetical protein Tchar_01536 [Tepidimonas charontis]